MPLHVFILVVPLLVLDANGFPPDQPQPISSESKPHRSTIQGGLSHSTGDWIRITGKVRVKNGYTIVFEDGAEVELAAGVELEQQGLINGQLYPAGKQAAQFLRKLIGDQTVTMNINATTEEYRRGEVKSGQCFVGETNLGFELIRGGWAFAGHSTLVPTEIMARDHQRGIWRGKFVPPDRWRMGERLPGE